MDPAYRHCAELVRASDKDRFLATLFAPAAQRGPLLALYAFNAEIASVRDRVREPMAGEIRLQWWRDVLDGGRRGEAAASPVAAALLDAMARHDLPAVALRELIEAHGFDLYDDPMPTLAAFEGHARKTASALFALGARIAGDGRDVARAAEHAGIAWSLTGHLRAFARHASRGQLYLPADVLERHGASAIEALSGTAGPGLHAALAELRGAARRHVSAFEALRLPAPAAPVFLTVALVPGYLAAMERRGYDPFRTAVEVPQWRRQWTLWRAARRYAGATGG